MNFLIQLARLKMMVKAAYKTKQFSKYSFVGTGTSFGQTARRINQTGNKRAISNRMSLQH